MKTAFYLEGDYVQVVLTPETKQESELLKMVQDKGIMSTYWGGFYHCQGGWLRHATKPYRPQHYDYTRTQDDYSLMIVLNQEVSDD